MQSLWMLFAAFAFSLMGVGVKLASELYTTGEIVFYRSAVSVAIMWVVLAARASRCARRTWSCTSSAACSA